ncbi:hypothetical protein [Latilactobacillus sakei]|uniref:hypothetical protein n=1 Tax=Latilactobacillus sakei TaxID=1599 RepID=UPI0024DF9586|nr:hypothetical protein [Latilactobacillus sakei]
MKTTYIESNKTWVISYVAMSENDKARQLARILKQEGKEVVLLLDDFEVIKKKRSFFDLLFKHEPIEYSMCEPGINIQYEIESIANSKEKTTAKFISKLDYYEQINLHIALLMADNPKLSTNDAYVFAATHFDNDDHTGLRYYLDKAMHMTTYK